MTVPLSSVRAELLAALALDAEWPVVDELDSPEVIHPPCVRLMRSLNVGPDAFGVRRYAFTVQLISREDTERASYERLLDAIGDGGYVDQLEENLKATSTFWTTARPSTTTEVTEEQYGQVLVQQAEITVEVWT